MRDATVELVSDLLITTDGFTGAERFQLVRSTKFQFHLKEFKSQMKENVIGMQAEYYFRFLIQVMHAMVGQNCFHF